LSLLLLLVGGLGACSASPEPNQGEGYKAFVNAGAEQSVPPELLLALSYQATRWQDPARAGEHAHHASEAAEPGEVGSLLMGELEAPRRYGIMGLSELELSRASQILGLSFEAIANDSKLNIKAAAAVLAEEAAKMMGPDFADKMSLEDWRDVIASSSGFEPELAIDYADEVMSLMRDGAGRQLESGEVIELVGNETLPPVFADEGEGLSRSSQRLTAASSVVDRVRAANSGNYNHGRSRAVDLIVIHTVQGGYSGCISWFQNPTAKVSAHYVVRSSDGEITQMVDEGDTAWHVRSSNSHAIGIEHEGYISDAAWYTDAMYRKSAALVCDIAKRHGLPLDRQHIMGHVEIPGNSHTDPGRYWDWDKYMSLVRSACGDSGASSSAGGSSTGSGSSAGTSTSTSTSTGSSASYTLEGLVFVQGHTSQRIPGATVTVAGKSAVTNSAGYYSVKVPAGSHSITASASGFQARSIRRGVSSDGVWGSIGLPYESTSSTSSNGSSGTSGSTTSTGSSVGAGNTGRGEIVGVVYASPSASQRIAGAHVRLSDGRSVSSDSEGYFSFSVPTGSYTVTASQTGFVTNSHSRTVKAGAKVWASVGLARQQAQSAAMGQLVGVVYEAPVTSRRLAGASVTLSNGQRTLTDASGMFRFEVAPGSYSLSASATGYLPRSHSRSVRANQETWGSLGLSPVPSGGAVGKVIGVVYASPSSSQRIPGASVWTSSGQRTTANASGVYTLSEVPAGPVQVFASAPGYRDGAVDRVVKSAGQVWASVPLTKVSTPVGAEGNGKPLPRPDPKALPQSGQGTGPIPDFQLLAPIQWTTAGSNPTFVWEGVPEMDPATDSFLIGVFEEQDEEATYFAVEATEPLVSAGTGIEGALGVSCAATELSLASPLPLAPGRYGWVVVIVDAEGVERFVSNIDTFIIE